ncbi:MAG TPA: polymer-forming cytoskeletal protein [Anaerolineaceae bacterium]|nr:polymer-forming cytoskeletal protein [Anaerolineaceae bacterium]
MKTIKSILLSLFITCGLLFTVIIPVHAQSQVCGSVVLGDSCVVPDGQTFNGDMVVFGGMVTLEQGATVDGDLALTGGSLEVYGTLNGDLVSTGGFVHLHDGAVINGDITRIGGNLVQDAGAEVNGNIITTTNSGINVPKDGLDFSRLREAFKPIRNFFRSIFQALAFAIIAIIVALVAPKGTDRLSKTIRGNFALCLGMGALGFLVVFLGSILFTITIIGIPLAILVLITFSIMLVFGWIGLGLELGRRMEKLFKTTWSSSIATSLGTLTLSLAMALIGWIPCLGWLVVTLVAMTGFGSAVLTRFGTRLPDSIHPDQPTPPAGPGNVVAVAQETANSHPAGEVQTLDEEDVKKMVSSSGWKSEGPDQNDPLPPAG